MGPEANSRSSTSRRSVENPPSAILNTPTTFFMAIEDDLEKSQSPATIDGSTFGIKSIEGTSVNEDFPTCEESVVDGDGQEVEGARRRSTLKPSPRLRDVAPEKIQAAFHTSSSGSSPLKPRRFSPPSASQSLTSLSQASIGPGSSLPSSPKSTSSRSFRPSDEESMYEGGSQAIASSEEDEAELPSEVHDSSPQLIMPSIRMPSRRPFTDRGKQLGRLKILIAGDSGIKVSKVCFETIADER